MYFACSATGSTQLLELCTAIICEMRESVQAENIFVHTQEDKFVHATTNSCALLENFQKVSQFLKLSHCEHLLGVYGHTRVNFCCASQSIHIYKNLATCAVSQPQTI